MIKEDYVSFEVAKLLKEKGFNEPYYRCSRVYNENGTLQPHHYVRIDGFKYISAPTLQMAMKWLREEHSIFIDIMSRFSMNADKDVCFSYSCKKLTGTYKSGYEYGDGEWLNYEEACEAAIKYCLENLI